ncbi:hypothetical protein [Roseateles amylovorans]|uniref:HTH iclR-type domain-containing protein n=1 Tax=Roseateles amylovorans TaxID=2978473 RepID=A0ABY6B5J5_9BURK|nr:hypothetical protein [Roseateles amylovorans]UXH79220.1 hypothetical protein N4261_04595 [Roseateles amylovorans]
MDRFLDPARETAPKPVLKPAPKPTLGPALTSEADVSEVPDHAAGDGEAVEDPVEAQARAALQALAELDGGKGVSLPRLAKRTGLRVSVLLRLYTLMSEARVGDQVGPGWVRLTVDEDGGRWLAHLTPAGRGEPEPDLPPTPTQTP